MAEAKQNNVNKPNSSVGLHFQKTFFCHLCQAALVLVKTQITTSL